jgi:glucose-6-phosphate dehydrogenase assembly protein OpcA
LFSDSPIFDTQDRDIPAIVANTDVGVTIILEDTPGVHWSHFTGAPVELEDEEARIVQMMIWWLKVTEPVDSIMLRRFCDLVVSDANFHSPMASWRKSAIWRLGTTHLQDDPWLREPISRCQRAIQNAPALVRAGFLATPLPPIPSPEEELMAELRSWKMHLNLWWENELPRKGLDGERLVPRALDFVARLPSFHTP